MSIRKIIIPLIIFLVLPIAVGLFFYQKFSNLFPDSMKMGGIMSNVPVFNSGLFSDDGNYFAYTYRPEIVKPDFDGSITIRGLGYPVYFQVMETSTGKSMIEDQYKTGKSDHLNVVWTEGDLVWLKEYKYHEGDRLALYDLKANKFRFTFGELEKLNPNISWNNSPRIYINSTSKKGLCLEGDDKRFYQIDPKSGKVEIIQGNLETVNYDYATDFQTDNLSYISDYATTQINGNRESITNSNKGLISEDDFMSVNGLTLTKNKKEGTSPLTYYKDNFFILSPILSKGDQSDKDKELSMLDKNTLKTVWKLQLPQKELKTLIPNYGYERFYIKENLLFVTNNNYLLKIDLEKGKIVEQFELFK